MLTSVATLIALLTLVALTFIWGRRYRILVQQYRLENEGLRDRLIRQADYCRQWREESIRLREIVDRVEG